MTSPSTAPLTTWNFAATINYGNKYYLSNYPNVREETDADSYGQYLDILDDADKVIARFNPKDIGGNVHTLQGNGVTIMSSPVSSGGYDPLSFVSKQSIPTRLSISAQNGLITFTYGSYAPVTRPVFDTTANWQNPRTLRLHFWTGSNATGYRQAIALGEATFSPAPTVSEMPAPRRPPPPSDGFNVGDKVKTTAKVNVRSTACNSGKPAKQGMGKIGNVIEGPTVGCGHIWVKVDFDTGADGWVAQDYLEKVCLQQDSLLRGLDDGPSHSLRILLNILLSVCHRATKATVQMPCSLPPATTSFSSCRGWNAGTALTRALLLTLFHAIHPAAPHRRGGSVLHLRLNPMNPEIYGEA